MIGLGTSLVKGGMSGRQYVKDGLKLYMPYRGADTTKGTQFVGTGSTSFDGANDYIDCGNNASLRITGNMTISAWVKSSSSARQRFITKYGSGTDDSFYLSIRPTTGKFRFNAASGEAESSSAVNDGDWHHLVAQYTTSTKLEVFIDGSSDGTDTSSIASALVDSDQNLRIGIESDDEYPMVGNMKNVAIWNRVLTATEVQNVMYKTYAEVSGRLASGLVSWWALEESKSGDATKAVDSKGSNEGTISGATVAAYGAATLYGGNTPVIPRGIDNAPTVQADAIGAGSALFDGSSEYIDCGGDIDITGAFTLTAWIKTDTIATSIRNIACQGNSFFALDDGSAGILTYQGQGSAGNNLQTQTALVVDKWYHIALSVAGTDAGDGRIYINGVRDDDNATTVFMAAGDFQIGKMPDASSRYWDGNISQVGIWDAALDQAQIQSIMEKTYEELTASEKEDLVSYWALDETVGNSLTGDNGVEDKVGETLGSELLTNGDFATGDLTGWSISAAWNGSIGVIYQDGGARLRSSGASVDIYQNILTSGKLYKVVFDISVYTSGNIYARAGDFYALGITGAGTHTNYLLADGATFKISRDGSGTHDYIIDNVSVKEVTSGNTGVLI